MMSGSFRCPHLPDTPVRPIRLVLAAASLACSSSQTSSTTSAGVAGAASTTVAPTERRNPDIITAAEITQLQGAANALEIVQRLRPNFLRVQERTSVGNTSSQPQVRLDGTLLGEVGELRGITATSVIEIRYYSIVQAESRFGGNRGRPVIAVTSRR